MKQRQRRKENFGLNSKGNGAYIRSYNILLRDSLTSQGYKEIRLQSDGIFLI